MDAGIPVACASDNVGDAFHPYGDYDAAEVLVQSVRLAHLDTRLGAAVRAVTAGAADIIGLPDAGRVAPGAPARLVLFPVRTFSQWLSRHGPARRLVDAESIRDSQPPSYEELREAAGSPPSVPNPRPPPSP